MFGDTRENTPIYSNKTIDSQKFGVYNSDKLCVDINLVSSKHLLINVKQK